ncbi:MAG: AAA family ATPase [Rhodobacterales bacterium]|nr:AAA family ATPase [Rhodobacterales bacterium]
MTADTQDDVLAFLATPAAFGRSVGPVERIDTHISAVFLCGDRALKLKRAVRFPFLDFTTLENRRAACEAEVRLNRRTAPTLYRGVRAVTRAEDGTLALDGPGTPVDWLVEMVRFDQDTLYDRLVVAEALDRRDMERLATAVARFHAEAEVITDLGGRDGLARTLGGVQDTFAQLPDALVDRPRVAELGEKARAALAGVGDLLDARRAAGAVRHGHGDLHLGNICCLDGEPTPFDAIEFNRIFACVDVLYDTAFLVMDLDHRRHRRLANVLFNRYMDLAALWFPAGADGLALLPLFLSTRASIRAHVHVSMSLGAATAAEAERHRAESAAYLAAAIAYLDPPPPRLVAVGGLSGSGKSRMGRELAPFLGAAPGARVVRTDVIRKRLAGVDATTRLDGAHYTAETTRRTYDTFLADAERALRAGQSVIADAVFARPHERQAMADLAARLGVPFDGLWLEAPEAVRLDRVTRRTDNPSDADAAVALAQSKYDIGPMSWKRIDSSGPREATVKKGLACLGLKS